MSLRRRIMVSTVLVVVLTVLASVGVGYWATQDRLGVFVEGIGDGEARQLAQGLSREYTAAGGWETADRALSQAGYTNNRAPERERPGAGEEEHSEREQFEFFHQDPVRVVIADLEGRVVKDNASLLPAGSFAPDLDGHRETVFDLNANEPVGRVYLDVGHELLSTESHGFLNTLLTITAIAGALTAGVAILLAVWLSKRITAPVAALTEATQAIAEGDTTRLPVGSSDELGRMSAAFNRMTSALEAQRELRRRLINDVSHELNTPLSVIKLEAKALGDRLQTPETASDNIIREVDRLAGLVTDLDSLAETDHGELGLTLEATPGQGLLTAEMNRWQPQAQAQEIELSLQAPAGLPDVDVDRARISQALGNIINNAIQATEPGGSIMIQAELENDGTLAITVTDDGIGIHPQDLPHIFDRSYQTDQSRSHGKPGKGLGLAITQTIIEAHKGTITATSKGPGQGTTITIHLPHNNQA